MKVKLLATVAILISSIGYSQNKYKIVYDYESDITSYYKVSNNNTILDTILTPKFKRKSLIEIQLKNVNPFAVEVTTDVKENNIHQTDSGFNFGSMLSSFSGMAVGGGLKLNPQNLGSDEAFFSRGKSRGTSDLQGLNDIITNVNAIKNSLKANMSNPNLDKQEIMKNLIELASKIDDSRIGDPNENFYLFLTTLDRIVLEYKLKLDSEIGTMFTEVDSIANNNPSLSRGATNLAYEGLRITQNSLGESTAQVTDDIRDIEMLYRALEASNFNVTYDYQLTSDNIDMQLNFKPSEFAIGSSKGPSTNIKTRNIKLFSTGGFSVNSSIALVMTNFGSNSSDYFIDKQGIIQEDKNDHFIPSMGAMMNFYPRVTENFNVGGTFGLSIPITDEIKGINFLIGPAIFIGNSNRISIAGGVAFGPMSKMTNGLKVGDIADVASLDNYKKTVYDFGYFFGVSFNVFNLN